MIHNDGWMPELLCDKYRDCSRDLEYFLSLTKVPEGIRTTKFNISVILNPTPYPLGHRAAAKYRIQELFILRQINNNT